MDLTIEKLGRENVDKKLKEYEKIMDIGAQAAQKLKGQNYGCVIQGESRNFDTDKLCSFYF